MKVVLDYDAGPWLAARLKALAGDGLDVQACREGDDAQLSALMKGADVRWHVLTPVTAAAIDGAPNLKLIQKIGVGVNTIDLARAEAKGIKVCNMPGTNSRAVAEMTLALMLAALRRLPHFDGETRRGRGWPLDPRRQDDMGEIAGRTVGLVGFGAVPRILAPVLASLGATVIYTSRAPKADAAFPWRPLADLLGESDIVSLHVPLTAETDRMIDATAIARMKPGAVLVNTARGGLVDESALIAALSGGHLRAAGLDVFAEEPAGAGNPLFRLENVVVAPHLAWLTRETLARSLTVAIENCRRLKSGEDLLHRVV